MYEIIWKGNNEVADLYIRYYSAIDLDSRV